MNPLKNPWGDKRDVKVGPGAIDSKCAYRSCLRVGENKGPFTQGKGYTSYYKNPELVCMQRHLHGCPLPIPEVDTDLMRCCPAPSFRKVSPKARKPQTQKCKLCGTRVPFDIAQKISTLPQLEHSRCTHKEAKNEEPLKGKTGWRHCVPCNQWFKRDPEPFTIGLTYGEVLDAIYPKTGAK